MKKLLFCVLAFMLGLSITVYCRAGEKEELLANQKALQWEFNYLQERAKTIQAEAQANQIKLQAIEKAEAEKKAKEEKEKSKIEGDVHKYGTQFNSKDQKK